MIIEMFAERVFWLPSRNPVYCSGIFLHFLVQMMHALFSKMPPIHRGKQNNQTFKSGTVPRVRQRLAGWQRLMESAIRISSVAEDEGLWPPDS